jgi:Zn-finger nucleic acid-binding protein/ribosomal protein L40E
MNHSLRDPVEFNTMLRLLVACTSCKRQYDASGRDPGDRFHCLCGNQLTVPAPRSHEAAVVRCSSCGATRQGDAPSCAHCGSDFTIHERDLHTICPVCAARVSDRARFCHHCATRLDPQGLAGEQTSKTCPACGDGHCMTSRDFGVAGLSILECPSCAGLWLGHSAFRHLVEHAETSSATSRVHAMAAARAAAAEPAPSRRAPPQGQFYRPCLECGQLMQRRNYGDRSGVIIDVCGAHGVWFDADELAAVLSWIRQGGSRLAREQAEERRRDRTRRAKPTVVPGTFPPFAEPRDIDDRGWTILEFLLEVGIFIFRLMR